MTKAADLPFFIYNIPGYCHYNLSNALFLRMIENERVAGIKNSSPAASDILRFRQLAGEHFVIFNGPDEQFLAGRMMGANGRHRLHLRLYARALFKAGGLYRKGRFHCGAEMAGISSRASYSSC